jgi:MFS transporter, FLVCR family, feline leukemia virus subgroup C receptor-related protein
MAINSSSELADITKDLKYFMFIAAVLSTFLAALILATFRSEAPDLPPSYYEALRRDKVIQNEEKSFIKSLKILLTNKNFVMLTIGYGLQLGIFNAFSTLINSIILYYFPVS